MAEAVVDVVFGLEGVSPPGRLEGEHGSAQREGSPMSVPSDHAWALWREVRLRLPWLAEEKTAGIHPLKTSPGGAGVALLARRAKLVLRVPERRVAATAELSGCTLAIGEGLVVSGGEARPLSPWHTLHAQRVATAARDDAAFGGEVERWLEARAIDCEFITGRRRTERAGEREITGFSVVLHGVKPADSLALQAEGMGEERGLGWGLFVPHKSILAVV